MFYGSTYNNELAKFNDCLPSPTLLLENKSHVANEIEIPEAPMFLDEQNLMIERVRPAWENGLPPLEYHVLKSFVLPG